CKNQLGEGPLWDVQEQMIYWVDGKNSEIWRHNPATGETRTWKTPEDPGSFALRENGKGLVVAMWNGFRFFDLETGETTVIEDMEQDLPTSRFNDGRCDRQGRFWVGSMDDKHTDPIGSLYRLDADLGHEVQERGVICSNSTCFSPDGETMYYADTYINTIWAYDLDTASGQLSNRRVFADTTDMKGVPDGSIVDAEGYLWNAMWDGWSVVRFAPDGTVDRIVEVPVQRPTCPMFGGKYLGQLYVTSARIGLEPDDLVNQPDAGALLMLDPGVKGVPETRFAG
ncbi:MAG: SMP-30/gluconolactonase/LRE family protein, partial [Alphaproteobacteria bacterium]|nr:SMP-30/gluconolactonase/LRE family protein [Alphaproteobacteria bacterium]